MNLCSLRTILLIMLLSLAAILHARPALSPNEECAFVENKGQWDSRVLFFARSPNLDTWITRDGVVYDLRRPDAGPSQSPRYSHASVAFTYDFPTSSFAYGIGALHGAFNYFLGKRQIVGVQRYAEVIQTLHRGMSRRWYFDDGKLRYDVIVAPGASVREFAVKTRGAEKIVKLADGLQIRTACGCIEERKLQAYQVDAGGRRSVSACFVEGRRGRLSLRVGPYNHRLPLVIDPLVYSTYLGPDGFSACNAIAVDAASNSIVGGYTSSASFPSALGTYQPAEKGFQNAFVAKIGSGGSLLYCTYLGGSGTDACNALAIDADGNPVLAGSTNSADFPVTTGGFQTTFGQVENGFVAKLSSDGSALLFSTYLGGSGGSGGMGDECNALALDPAGDPVVAGSAYSANFPTTPGAYQTAFKGTQNGFVSKLSSDGSKLLFSTLLGGSGAYGDYCTGLKLTPASEPVVVGTAQSNDFPTTSGAFQAHLQGDENAFVAKFSADGSTLESSTLLGGSRTEMANAVALDSSGNAVVAGLATSTDFPATSGSFQTKLVGRADQNGFVAKVAPDGRSLIFATLLGGSGDSSNNGDACEAVALDQAGNIVVAGFTSSADFPRTLGASQSTLLGVQNGFLAMLSGDGTALLHSTLIGGIAGDSCNALALDSAKGPRVAGATTSPNFPVTVGAAQTFYSGGSYGTSGFVSALQPLPTISQTVCALTVTPPQIVGGNNGAAKVSVGNTAPSTGTLVSLVSGNPAVLSVPATVMIPAGHTTAQFAFTTSGTSYALVVNVLAVCNRGAKEVSATVLPAQLTNIAFGATSVNPGRGVGVTFTLNGKAPAGGLVVTSSSNPPNLLLNPSTVLIPAGASSFTAGMVAGSPSQATQVTLSATLGKVTKSATITVN